jgi:hypothetical protein
MARMQRTTVVTFPAALRRMFMSGGETYNWFEVNVRVPMHRNARNRAPFRRHGGLKRGMYSRSRGYNQYRIDITVGNLAEYATFVHEGTQGLIFAKSGPWLKLGIQSATGPGDPRRMNLDAVNGQDANPFIDDAMQWALARKRLS